MHKQLLIGLILLFGQACLAQQDVPIDSLIDTNLEPSHITFTGGINFQGSHGHFGDQIMEAELDQHFQWFEHGPKFLSLSGSMKVNAKIQIRMLTDNSAPIRTPGFLPRVTYFFWFDKEERIRKTDNFYYYSIMLSHHSNGQSGDFYNPNGTINTSDASFSTNFFEFAAYQIWGISWMPSWTKVSFEWHPGFNRAPELKNQYEKTKIVLSARNQSLPILSSAFLTWKFKLYSSVSYITSGRTYVLAPDPDFPSKKVQKAKFPDNVNLTSQLNIRPKGWHDIDLFARYDHGYDYYNINFWKKLNRIQIGLAADPTGFVNLKKRMPK